MFVVSSLIDGDFVLVYTSNVSIAWNELLCVRVIKVPCWPGNTQCSQHLCSHNRKHIAYTFVKMKAKSTNPRCTWIVCFCFFFLNICARQEWMCERIWEWKMYGCMPLLWRKSIFQETNEKKTNLRKMLKFKLDCHVYETMCNIDCRTEKLCVSFFNLKNSEAPLNDINSFWSIHFCNALNAWSDENLSWHNKNCTYATLSVVFGLTGSKLRWLHDGLRFIELFATLPLKVTNKRGCANQPFHCICLWLGDLKRRWCSEQTIFRRINHEIVNLTHFQAFCICLMNYKQTIQLVCECGNFITYQLWVSKVMLRKVSKLNSPILCVAPVCAFLSLSCSWSSSSFGPCLCLYFCLFMSPFFAFVLINFMFGFVWICHL